MKKKIISRNIFIIILVLSIFVKDVITVYIPTFRLLDSIHYDIESYVNDVLTTFMNGSSISFDGHRIAFEIISRNIHYFVDEHPDFFEKFDSSATLSKYGVKFYEKDSGDMYLHIITSDSWRYAVSNIKGAFARSFFGIEHDNDVRFDVHPGYIVFGSRYALVNTRDRSYPKEYIDSLWEIEYKRVVNVINHARGWYEILKE